MRAGIVLHRSGGILKLARIPFWLGLGGRIAGGQQWFPTVSLADYLSAASLLIRDDSLDGSFNVVAPASATNAEFTRELARVLRRPAVLPVPGFAIRAIAGDDLSVQLLGSIRARPRRLLDAGFEFAHPTVRDQLEAALD
jgi:NAD dependent epimerase/dehydratase family enzyme